MTSVTNREIPHSEKALGATQHNFCIFNTNLWCEIGLPLADLEEACPAHAPQGSRFFRFDIQNFQNVTALGVHAPLWEILDPPLKSTLFIIIIVIIIMSET